MLTIIDGNKTINLEELDLTCLSFQVEPLEANHEMGTVEGVDGYADIDTNYNGRHLYSRWFLKVSDRSEFHGIKDKIYSLFAPKKELILIDSRQPFKKWTARVESQTRIDDEEGSTFKVFEVIFVSKNVYAESAEPYKETFTTNQFVVFNDGEEIIDAREHQLVIKFKGASDKLRIRNESTGSQWQYLKTTTVSDELVLDQVYPYKNDKNIFTDTDHGAITLATGSNDIRVYGASGNYEISFEFLPLYV